MSDPFALDKVTDVETMIRTQDELVDKFQNLPNVLLRGRLVERVPTGSSDVDATDRLGDISIQADYLYVLIDNSGAAWRRVALSSW